MSDPIDTWHQSMTQIITLCEPLDDAQWQAQTPCPGWTVADVVAHLIDVEAMLAGDPRPNHQPDWSSLPHVNSDFGRATEVGVDVRRGRSKGDVLGELRTMLPRREAELRAADGPVRGIFGNSVDLDLLLSMRIFDSWVHEQDIRTAIDQPGGLDSIAAQHAAQLMLRGLPKAWGKGVAPAVGTTLRITITGPDIEADTTLVIDDEGRAVPTEAPAPDVHLTMSWPHYALAASGRVDIQDAQWRAGVTTVGDPDLVDRTLRALNIAP